MTRSAAQPSPGARLRSRAGWLALLSIVTVAAVNAAGLFAIASARRAARDGATRLLQVETQARAQAQQRVLERTRSNLEFVAASSALARLALLAGALPGGAREAESALLVFLRSHPEAIRLAMRSQRGVPLIHMGRRGGIPILWVSTNPTGTEGAAIDPTRPRLITSVEVPATPPAGAGMRLETEISPALLLEQSGVASRDCVLQDAAGTRLAGREPRAGAEPMLRAVAVVPAAGWSAAAPWSLTCWSAESQVVALVEPVAARSGAALGLNLAAMALVLVLGALAIQENARRERTDAIAREATRVRELERQLFHAERLATVGRLAAGIAHEINNPLEGMANYLCLARDALASGDLAGAARRLGSVEQGLLQAAGIVRQVLAHADPATAPHTPVDLNPIVAAAIGFMRSRSEFAGIAFAADLAPAPMLVQGSAIMLGQVVSNLVINASEAQPAGGEVRVSVRREGARVMLDVADRGPGIATADRERVFEPFFSTKDSTGLGLSVCHSIVREHAGQLTLAPRPGGGTVFRIDLPALEGASR